uniref:Uncharacterized protein n=1 Tax=Anopheles coluzzii TaxID=1518534 RepID=A0A8W7PZE8_ANOCL
MLMGGGGGGGTTPEEETHTDSCTKIQTIIGGLTIAEYEGSPRRFGTIYSSSYADGGTIRPGGASFPRPGFPKRVEPSAAPYDQLDDGRPRQIELGKGPSETSFYNIKGNMVAEPISITKPILIPKLIPIPNPIPIPESILIPKPIPILDPIPIPILDLFPIPIMDLIPISKPIPIPITALESTLEWAPDQTPESESIPASETAPELIPNTESESGSEMSAFQTDTKYYDRPQAGSLEEDFTIPAGGTGRKPHSFALSPEMDYRSGCGTAEFGTTFRPVSYGRVQKPGGGNGTGEAKEILNEPCVEYDDMCNSMPILEDGLSSGHASDSEGNTVATVAIKAAI